MSQQGDAPPDPNRRDFLKKFGLAGPAVAVAASLAAGGLSMGGGGLSQGVADGLYIRRNISAGVPELAKTFDASPWRFQNNNPVRYIDLDPVHPQIIIQNDILDQNVVITGGQGLQVTNVSSLGDILIFSVTDVTTGNLGSVVLNATSFTFQTNTKLALVGTGLSMDDGAVGTTASVTVNSITPAQVGLPTASAGVAQGLNRPDHRHAFSGRFLFSGLEFNALLPGGAFPDKFARLKINNNWTLRRIWVFTKNGPTGGTETYGIVNAAGVLQGTAVVLPASAGALSEAESALQVTNLAGGTLYYLAQTASGAVVASTNVEVGIEYTMNI